MRRGDGRSSRVFTASEGDGRNFQYLTVPQKNKVPVNPLFFRVKPIEEMDTLSANMYSRPELLHCFPRGTERRNTKKQEAEKVVWKGSRVGGRRTREEREGATVFLRWPLLLKVDSSGTQLTETSEIRPRHRAGRIHTVQAAKLWLRCTTHVVRRWYSTHYTGYRRSTVHTIHSLYSSAEC